MKLPLPVPGGRVASQVCWPVFLVGAVSVMVGCRAAESFRLNADYPDAAPLLRSDGPGLGGAGGAIEASGGAGGEQDGRGGTGGSGGGGSIVAGSGGSSDAASDSRFGGDVANGSGESAQPDTSSDIAAGTGGDAGPIDSPPDIGVSYCQNTGWTATASASWSATTRPPAGIDGDLSTRWGNGRFQDGTDWYEVDFGGPVRLDGITLDNTGTYPGDYPGGYAVYGSTDGATFSGPFVTGSGANPKTVIEFPAQTVRAIKINQTGTSRHAYWWQIGELQIHCLM